MIAPCTGRPGRRRERGIFSLVEVMLATLVLALSATATAYWVETVGNLSSDADEQTIGLTLVKNVEGVVSPLPFREPGSGSTLGPEAGESLQTFDDVDDFHLFACTPPIDGERDPLPDLAEWKVTVVVEPVDPTNLKVVASSDVRRVRVRAMRDGESMSEVWWLRSRSPFE